MSTVIDISFFITGNLMLAAILYLYFLAVASIWPEGRKKEQLPSATKFAVVVPAHNEEEVIGRTIESLRSVDYPENLYEVFVVADNCSDNTAEVIRQSGPVCLERRDEVNKGKGYVLKWAFERILKEGDHEAFVVVDADTLMDGRFLRAVDMRIQAGEKAVQGYYDVLNPEQSPMGGLSYLGFVLTRNLRYKGRTRLGWTSNLLGNGMCFTREVIERFGWNALSVVEDIEYEMILLLGGVRVAFAPEARIYAEIPETFRRSRVQRGRWDLGKFEVRNRYLGKLLREGLRKRDFSYLDAALELLIPPFSFLVMLVVAGFALFMVFGYKGIDLNFVLWSTVVGGMGMYILGGLMLARASFRVYLSLLYAPYFLFWRLWVVLQGIVQKNHESWVKTERK